MMACSVQVVSRRMVKPPPRRRERIPLTSWDVSMLSGDYVQTGLLFAPPPFSTAHLVEHHLHPALADALATYYPVAGRLATEPVGSSSSYCSVSIDCAGQGVELIHAVVAGTGVTVADVVPPDADVPTAIVRSLFPLDGAVNYDGRQVPLIAVQVTELADGGVFLGFACNHALCDGKARWDFVNTWAEAARHRLALTSLSSLSSSRSRARAPLFERCSTAAPPAVLPYSEHALAELVERERRPTPRLRERMLHFSAASLEALKAQARQELLAAGDMASAVAVTKFQALASLLWRCFTAARARARRLEHRPDPTVCCRFAIDNRERLRPPLPAEYFGNAVYAVPTEAVGASELLARGHGWAAAAVGRAVAAHTDAAIRARVAAWAAHPTVSLLRLSDPNGMVLSSSPRFDLYGCDFGWGKPLAARSGGANKYDGKVTLFPGREGGGSIDAEVALAPDHMAALEQDDELWAAVSAYAAAANVPGRGFPCWCKPNGVASVTWRQTAGREHRHLNSNGRAQGVVAVEPGDHGHDVTC